MAETNTKSNLTIIRVIAWPLVAALALFLFKNQIAAAIPSLTKIQIGSLLIEKQSSLGQKADDDVIAALGGLTRSSIFNLISRSTNLVCFSVMDPNMTRNDHAQLIQKGLIIEINSVDLPDACSGKIDNPNIGLKLTDLGEKVRSFQLGVLEDLSADNTEAVPQKN